MNTKETVTVMKLAVFARPPVAGRVKSRLSPALPHAQAAELYGAMLSDALDVAAGAGADEAQVWWAGLPEDPLPFPLPAGFAVRTQRGTDLGERLAGAFAELLADRVSRAVVIGTDCPDLGPATIREAFAALSERDLVLGPAIDGGYYLIGLRRPAPGLFPGMPWGTGDVLAETLARARHAGLDAGTLEPLADLDTPDDLVRLVARWCVAPPGPGRRTRASLEGLGLLPSRR
jgi:hypothetical protein